MDLSLMFSSDFEIFSTFYINPPVYGCPFLVRFNLTNSTIVNHRFAAGPVRPADKRHLTEKKVSWYLKKNYLKNRQQFYIVDDY